MPPPAGFANMVASYPFDMARLGTPMSPIIQSVLATYRRADPFGSGRDMLLSGNNIHNNNLPFHAGRIGGRGPNVHKYLDMSCVIFYHPCALAPASNSIHTPDFLTCPAGSLSP